MENMRVLRVTGKGMLRLKPDTTRITITLQGCCEEYAETLRRSSEDTAALQGVLAGFGFAREDLKTLNFSVDTEYEGYQEEGVWKQRFKGYRFAHALKVEFPSDNDLLGRILYALAKCPVDPEFRISYTLKDQEAAKNQLLAKAVADAKAKAVVLAEASGVALKELQSIDYSWGQISFEAPMMNRVMLAKSAAGGAAEESLDMNVQPDDIEVSDTVTLVWAIA